MCAWELWTGNRLQRTKKGKRDHYYKEQKTCVHLCAHLSICPDVCWFECLSESNEVQPGQKGYWNGFKVAQSLSALSPCKQGGWLARCRADKVFLMALKCIIYFKKLAFVLFCEKQFEKRCSICTFLLLGHHFQWLTQYVCYKATWLKPNWSYEAKIHKPKNTESVFFF